MITIKVKRNRGLLRRLDMASKVINEIVQEEIEATAADIYDLATQDTVVDFGILKAGNNFEVGELRSENYNTVSYAPYVEFGTGGLVDVPAGLEEYASQFKGEGIKQINLLPRPFLFPNARQQSKILVDRVRRRTLKYLK